MKIGISACLCGRNVRYDGGNKKNQEILDLLKDHELIMVCPEEAAGFSIPRHPLEIKEGKVLDRKGQDLSDELLQGSLRCFSRIEDCDFLILKQKSPSCGYGLIHDGSFSGKLIEGNGIFTSLCLEKGMKIFSEDDIEAIKKEL